MLLEKLQRKISFLFLGNILSGTMCRGIARLPPLLGLFVVVSSKTLRKCKLYGTMSSIQSYESLRLTTASC